MKSSYYGEDFDHDALHKQLSLLQDMIGQVFPTIKMVNSVPTVCSYSNEH